MAARKNKAKNRPALEITQTRTEIACSTQFFSSLLGTRQLSIEHNLLLAARHIFKLGPKALVIKRGEYGAMLVHQNRTFSVAAFPLGQVHDPT